MSTTATTDLKDLVKENTERLKGLVEENEKILGAAFAKAEDGTVATITDEMRAAFGKNTTEIQSLTTAIQSAKATLVGQDYLKAPDGTPIGVEAGMNGSPERFGMRKSVGSQFIESEAFKSLQGGKAGYTMRVPFEAPIADLAGQCILGAKDVYTDLPGGTPGRFGAVQRDALVERQRRRSRVRDLFPIQGTTAGVIEYFRQTGFTNNASPVPERTAGAFTLKPHSTIAFDGATATIRTIAHWEAAHRNALADEPQLRGIIDTELLYGLQLVEDAQILAGTGSGEDLPGILNDPGIQQYDLTSGPTGGTASPDIATDNKADAIRRAATMVMLAYYEPTGVVVHDSDWEDMELTKDDNGQYLLAVSIALGGEPRLWRMPVVSTPAIPAGTALVGAFGLGATLYDRENATIRVAEQHADFFVRNGIVVLAEERIGLAIKRPEAFVEVSLS